MAAWLIVKLAENEIVCMEEMKELDIYLCINLSLNAILSLKYWKILFYVCWIFDCRVNHPFNWNIYTKWFLTNTAQKWLSKVFDVIVFMKHINMIFQLLFIVPSEENTQHTWDETKEEKTLYWVYILVLLCNTAEATVFKLDVNERKKETQMYALCLQLSYLCIQLLSPPFQFCHLLRRANICTLGYLKLWGAKQPWVQDLNVRPSERRSTYRWFEVRVHFSKLWEWSSGKTVEDNYILGTTHKKECFLCWMV